MSDRKREHIELAFKSQTTAAEADSRFVYEPLLSEHPTGLTPKRFLGKTLRTPIWACSMTGGTELAKKINENIARVCKDFGMGMGLGSCRTLLDDDTYFEDFDVRKYIGDAQPLYANLGIAQIDSLLLNNASDKIKPEGNRIARPSIDIIEELVEKAAYPLIIKEVGQGMGSESLKRLLLLPIQAIEFGAFGGANFSMIELLRKDKDECDSYKPLAYVGQTAEQMVAAINHLAGRVDLVCRQLIISGGIKNFFDGYYLMKKSAVPAVYGQASAILKFAKQSYEQLYKYIEMQAQGLSLAEAFLRINPDHLGLSVVEEEFARAEVEARHRAFG